MQVSNKCNVYMASSTAFSGKGINRSNARPIRKVSDELGLAYYYNRPKTAFGRFIYKLKVAMEKKFGDV